MNEPTTKTGRQAVEMRGQFNSETKERASKWVALIEAEARADCEDIQRALYACQDAYEALTREPGLDGVRAAWLALALGRRSRGGSDEWWEMPATLSEALAIAREYGVIAEEEATKYAALASEDRP